MRGYSTCYGHRPDFADERKRNAARGGSIGGRGRDGRGELADLKRRAARLYKQVETGEIDPRRGAVLTQVAHLQARVVEMERRARWEDHETLTVEEAMQLVAAITEPLMRRVHDRRILAAIRQDYEATMEAKGWRTGS